MKLTWNFQRGGGGGFQIKKILCGMCGSRKYPYSPHRRDWKFWGGERSQRPKNLHVKQSMKLNWNFRRGGVGGHMANPFRGGGGGGGGYGYFLEPHNEYMDIFMEQHIFTKSVSEIMSRICYVNSKLQYYFVQSIYHQPFGNLSIMFLCKCSAANCAALWPACPSNTP